MVISIENNGPTYKCKVSNYMDSTQVSSFQNWLNDLFSSTGFYFESNVIEGSHKEENMFFNFWTLLLKMYIFEVVNSQYEL